MRGLCHESATRLDEGIPFVDAFTSIINDFLFGIYLFFQAIIDWLVSHWYIWVVIGLAMGWLIWRFIVAMEKGIKKGNPNKVARMLMQFRNFFIKNEPRYKPESPPMEKIPIYEHPTVISKSLPTEQQRFIGYGYADQE